MRVEILYLIIGIVAIVILMNNKCGLSKMFKTKEFWCSIGVLVVTALLMFLVSNFIPCLFNLDAIIIGCICSLFIPLSLAFLSIFIINKVLEIKQTGVMVSIIIAIFSCVIGCFFEYKYLTEVQQYISNVDFNDAMSLLEMNTYEPKYGGLPAIFILLPVISKLAISIISQKKNN